MAIIYPDELEMLKNENIVMTKEIKFDVELYIYIQKLMRESDKSFDEILNNIIREHAENSITSKPVYVPLRYVPYNPYEPIIYRYGSICNTHVDLDAVKNTSTYFTSDYHGKYI